MSTYMRRGAGKATLFPDAQVSALQALGWVALTAQLNAPAGVKMLAAGNNIYPVNQDGTFYADPADVPQLLSQGASIASGAASVYMRRITGEGVAVPSAEETAQQSIGWTALTTQLAAPSGTKVMEVNGNAYPVGPDGTIWADPADAAALTSQGATTVTVTAAPVAPYVITAPTLSSASPVVGAPNTATAGVYGGSPAPTVTRQWFYGDTGAPISGATTTSYTPVSADLGHTLMYIETATNASGSVASAAPTTAAVGAAPTVPPDTIVYGATPTSYLVFGATPTSYVQYGN